MDRETAMSCESPTILLVDDSPDFRGYLRKRFEEASWLVHEWDLASRTPELADDFPPLTAALADRHLGDRTPYSGLEVLQAIRARNPLAACVLYTIQARAADWQLLRDQARKAEILALPPGSNTQHDLYERVVQEVKRRRPEFREPMWQDLESWIQPDADPRLAQVIDSVGRDQLARLIEKLFKERGPDRPIRYTFLTPGYSGARVVLVTDPVGTANSGPRYILKVAPGDRGWVALQKERRCFHDLILGGASRPQRLRGYVAEELRPAADGSGPERAGDWFGIAYKEVGNGNGRVLSFRDLYLEPQKDGDPDGDFQRLDRFLDHLYVDCLGHACHREATVRARPLWGNGEESGACYQLAADKRYEIFAALEGLQRRAGHHLEAAEQLVSRLVAFLDNGRCGGPPYEPTVFQRIFPVLSASTHGDLHAGNVLAVQRQGGSLEPFVIDFSEYTETGHPFYDYARLENDVRLRLMNFEDGSDVLAELLPRWFGKEEALLSSLGEPRAANREPTAVAGPAFFTQKGYRLIGKIRALAYQNLADGLNDRDVRPSRSSFNAQYLAALLHRTLISLASTDVVELKKVLALWLATRLISELGEAARTAA